MTNKDHNFYILHHFIIKRKNEIKYFSDCDLPSTYPFFFSTLPETDIFYFGLTLFGVCLSAVLSKFVGPVGQSDIFYECLTKIVRVSDQMSDRKYKNIHLVDEKKRNTNGHKGQQLRFMSSHCFCRHW